MSQDTPHILLIEDDKPILNFIKSSLLNKGYDVTAVETGEAGLSEAEQHVPDIVITDLGLPDMDGVEVITSLRQWTDLPIIVLSARENEADKLEALENGADDYLTKPFGLNELLARMRVSLRHAHLMKGKDSPEAQIFTIGDISFDLEARHLLKNEQVIHLTENEAKLLATLLKYRGQIVTQRLLINEVWGTDNIEHPQYLQVFMASLKRKLEDDPAHPRYLLAEHGIGYRFVDDCEVERSST